MVKPCEICGDIGESSAIITCSECKSTREHLYCMRIVRIDPHPFWTCDECVEKKLTSSQITVKEDTPEASTEKISTLKQKSPRFAEGKNKNVIANRFTFKEKGVSTGRTQYLSCDEVVKMSSGSDKSNCSPRKEFLPALVTSKSMPPPRERAPLKSPQIGKGNKSDSGLQKLASQQSPFPKEIIAKSLKISRRDERASIERESKIARFEVLPPVTEEGDVARTHVEVAKSSEIPEKPDTKSVTKAVRFEVPRSITEEADVGVHAKVAKSSEILEKSDTNSGTKMGCKNDADVVASPLAVSETFDPYIPALNSYWKGSLNLPNGYENFSGSFMAHPPSRVHIKVYETIVTMPESLSCELVPYHGIYLEIFQSCLPDKDDIGVYFFPMFNKRSENSTIIDFLWSESLMMKTVVNGVELLVFSSRLLHPQSQEFQGKYFLCGVFRPPQNGVKVAEKLPLLEEKCKPCDKFPPGFERIWQPRG